ncbi:IS3 family transposase [Nesterenkonia sp. E16_7]|nr:IS3 family transposase [Nesterenkonia sp. E16_10]MBO0599007.1 IS3 family transposase [Nesterenkonia sp. E16_7]
MAYIDAHRGDFGFEPIGQVFTRPGIKIAPSTNYAPKTRPPSVRSISGAALTEAITQVHTENYWVCGINKVHAELHRQGHRVARCTVLRLMRAASLRGSNRTDTSHTTVPSMGPEYRPDLVPRSLPAAAPDQLGLRIPPTVGPSPGGPSPHSSSQCSPAGWWAGSSRLRRTDLGWTLWRWVCGPVPRRTDGPAGWSITATRESNMSPCATPSVWPRPARCPE